MDVVLRFVNIRIVDPILLGKSPQEIPDYDRFALDGGDPNYSIPRQFVVLVVFMYFSSLVLYLFAAGTTFLAFFYPWNRKKWEDENGKIPANVNGGFENYAWWGFDWKQARAEVWTTVWSSFFMAIMTAPVEIGAMYGYAKIYYNIDDYGWTRVCINIVGFLCMNDTMIYWIHRMLHWPQFYPLHKLHHRFKETTPFSSLSFHPVDGVVQSIPYHLYVYLFPMHHIQYSLSLGFVILWTISIHDRMTCRIPYLLCAAHHTYHHTKFNFNYGGYTTFWDKWGGTYLNPFQKPMYSIPPRPDKAIKHADRERDLNGQCKPED